MIQVQQKRANDPIEIVRLACKAIADKKGLDIAAFNVSGLSSFTDYVVIASGLNAPHLKAMVNETIMRLKKNGDRCFRKTGEPDSGWIIADFLDVMIHFFTREQREYYDLDGLLEHAPRATIKFS